MLNDLHAEFSYMCHGEEMHTDSHRCDTVLNIVHELYVPKTGTETQTSLGNVSALFNIQ